MDIDKLRGSPIGKLIPIKGYDPRFREQYEGYAYVPDPLPSEFTLEGATYATVVDATAAMARADQAASLLPNPALLARPATRREAVSTSALEGTYAALSDVFEADFLEADEMTHSVSEVRNYVTAAEAAYDLIAKGQPITIRMLEDLQSELLRGTPSDGPHVGSVRTTQVFIVRGHEKVPTGGQVEVSSFGRIKVSTPCSSCRSGTAGPDGDGEGANQSPSPSGSSIEICEGPHGHHFRLLRARVVPGCRR